MGRGLMGLVLEAGMTAAAFAFVAVSLFVPSAFSPALRIGRSEFQDLQENNTMTSNHYLGLWVTGDGHIRHELLPNGRYIEARGNKERAYQGRYQVKGDHIDYVDDTGFTADGDFRQGILYHAGMVLYRD